MFRPVKFTVDVHFKILLYLCVIYRGTIYAVNEILSVTISIQYVGDRQYITFGGVEDHCV